MSKVVLALAATTVGLGLLNLHLVKQMRAGQTTIAGLQQQVATLEKQQQARPPMPLGVTAVPPAKLEQRVVPPPSGVSGRIVAFNNTVPPAPVGLGQPQPPSREERMRMMRESRERQRQLMQDPEYREAMQVQARSNFARAYPGLTDELGFDAQQADEFFGLLSEQQLRATEQLEPMWDMEGKDATAIQEQQRKVQQQAEQLQKKSDAEIAARFGQDKLQSWKDYQSTLGVRHQLEQMRSNLAAQGLPLNEADNKAMLSALAQAQKAEADEFSAAMARGAGPMQGRLAMVGGNLPSDMVERQMEATKKRNQRTLDAIGPYLTYEQRQIIEKEHEAQLKVQEAHMRIMRAQGSANRPYLSSDPNGQAVILTQ